MDISFVGQVAVITGAGRALGREYAHEIARRGGRVVVSDIGGAGTAEGPWAEAVAVDIRAAGGEAVASMESVSEPAGANRTIEAAMDAFGRVDAVIHNAGFLRPGFIEDLTDSQIREVIDVHLMGGFYIVRPAWRIMKRQGYGRVVMTGSGAAFGNAANSNYAAAKAGLLGLTTSLALEHGGMDLKANMIMPYAVSTIASENPIPGNEADRYRAAYAKTAPRRHPRSVTPLAAYLASSACAVSGQAFSALAGRYARVGLSIACGWIGDPDLATAETIGDRLADISDWQGAAYPPSMADEILDVLDRLQGAGLISE